MNLVAWWNSLPYWLTGSLVRAARVFLYAAIPAIGAWLVVTANVVSDPNGVVHFRDLASNLLLALSAAVIALLDKGQRELRVAAKAESDVSGPSDPDVVDGPTDTVSPPADPIIPPDDKDPSGPVAPPPAPGDI